MENTKICTKCGRELPLECFNKCKSRKDGLQTYCKECLKQYKVDNAEAIKERKKQYYVDNAEAIKQHNKQYYADNAEAIKEYNKQRYATLEGYARSIRNGNLREDRKKGRISKDEDPLPSLEYYIWALQQKDFYDGKQYPFNEMGFDRIDDSKPHTIDNMVVATTFHNVDRWHKRMTVEEYKELMRK